MEYLIVLLLVHNSNILDNAKAMAFKLRMMFEMHGIHSHAHFGDHDHDFENVW